MNIKIASLTSMSFALNNDERYYILYLLLAAMAGIKRLNTTYNKNTIKRR